MSADHSVRITTPERDPAQRATSRHQLLGHDLRRVQHLTTTQRKTNMAACYPQSGPRRPELRWGSGLRTVTTPTLLLTPRDAPSASGCLTSARPRVLHSGGPSENCGPGRGGWTLNASLIKNHLSDSSSTTPDPVHMFPFDFPEHGAVGQ